MVLRLRQDAARSGRHATKELRALVAGHVQGQHGEVAIGRLATMVRLGLSLPVGLVGKARWG